MDGSSGYGRTRTHPDAPGGRVTVRRASTGLAEAVCPSSSSRRDESERRRDASGISPADTSSRQPSGASSRKSSAKRRGALSRHKSRSVAAAVAAAAPLAPLAPLASAGESGAADSSRRGAGLSVPRTAAPADDPGRQASSRSDRSAAAALCFIRVPPFPFCKIVCYFINLAFLLCMGNGVFFEKSPVFMHRTAGRRVPDFRAKIFLKSGEKSY